MSTALTPLKKKPLFTKITDLVNNPDIEGRIGGDLSGGYPVRGADEPDSSGPLHLNKPNSVRKVAVDYKTTPAYHKLERCRAYLLQAQPWFGTLLLHLPLVPGREDDPFKTMATNGRYISYHDEFVMSHTEREIAATLAHEVAHCVLLHLSRRLGRDPLCWNIAADRAANALLVAAGMSLPPGGIPPGELGLTAEEQYDEGDVQYIDIANIDLIGGLSEDEKEQLKKDWRSAVSSARHYMPSGIRKVIDQANAVKLNWKNIVQNWFSSRIQEDEVSWKRLHRRLPYMLPGSIQTPAANIAIVSDTSGSIGDEELSIYRTEIRAAISTTGLKATIIHADDAVAAEINPGDPLPDDFSGGGGTDFAPALARCVELGVDGIVYLTDGLAEWPEDPGIPVLWVLTKPSPHCPWGETAEID